MRKEGKDKVIPIVNVVKGSPADKAGIRAGDRLESIGSVKIRDVLDYQFYATDENCSVTVVREEKKLSFRLKNREYQDLGMEFETYLMDKKKTCANRCIFCFIDQNPPCMRETIYFKDDDERLSFLQGNYVTMTNLRDEDVGRIVRMHMSPVNVSVHTTNPELRVRMMGNRFAGEKLKYLKTLDEGGIQLNAQLVLCRGINDGEELQRTLDDLCELENLQSLAAVPCGMTDHREGLPEIRPFDRDSAADVVKRMEKKASECLKKRGSRLVYASDEFYLEAGIPIPEAEAYEDYPQLENGVGMLRLHTEEFREALEEKEENACSHRHVSVATGVLAFPHLKELAEMTMKKYPFLRIDVYPIVNDFFGHSITVSGLVTGGDLIRQLKGKDLGETLLIPENMVRYEGHLFLDNVSVEDAERELGLPLTVTDADGADLLEKFLC